MSDTRRSIRLWLFVLGSLALIGALHVARDVVVPIVLAVLITFILSTPASWLERRIGRVPAVIGLVLAVFAIFGAAGWGLSRQAGDLAADLPQYRANLEGKFAQVQAMGTRGPLGRWMQSVRGEKPPTAATPGAAKVTTTAPIPTSESSTSALNPASWLSGVAGAAGTTGLVMVLVIFMLLERRDLRDRLLSLVGHGRMALTTRALDEAGSRVAKQLLMQTLVNLIYGVVAGLGLWIIGVPYAFLWAALAGALRFIPYLGSIVGAGSALLVSIAAFPGWQEPIYVGVLFIALELFTNLVLETILYAGAAGVSQVGLLVAISFWTWLWGPLGLLMATPLTVCLVVMGKYVPGLEFIGTLFADTPPLSVTEGFYQRLLARDIGEASELLEKQVPLSVTPRAVYDMLIVPALTHARIDVAENRLSMAESKEIVRSAEELMPDVIGAVRRAESAAGLTVATTAAEPLRVLGYAVTDDVDRVALQALAGAVDDLPVTLEMTSTLLASELAPWIADNRYSVVCLVDLPPSSPSRVRYLVRKLRAAHPTLRILVGRWSSDMLTDDSVSLLLAAGATHVGTSIEATRAYLREAARMQPAAEPLSVGAVTAG